MIPESYLKRMDWMYVQSNTKENTKEDLFGNILKPAEEPEKKKIVPIVKDSTINEDYEAFVRFHEDPLVDILKAQERAKIEMLDNPLKLREIQREIEMLKEGKRKKHKHHKSDRHKRREDSHERSRKRSRSRRHREERHSREYISREKEELGPTKEMKQGYREVKEMEALRKKQKINYRNLTEEEKAQKVEEMKQDAMKGKEELLKYRNDYVEEKQVNPEFIRTMRTKVYTGGDMTVEDKIKRNRHYNQRIEKVRDQNE